LNTNETPNRGNPGWVLALSVDTQVQLEDLMTVFWSSDMTAAEAQGKHADIIEEAD
jgi:glucose/mannose transport system substrate-binding protein